MKCELCGNDAEIQRKGVLDIKAHYFCKDCIMKRESDWATEECRCEQCGNPINCVMEPNGLDDLSYLYCSRECYLKHRGYKLLSEANDDNGDT